MSTPLLPLLSEAVVDTIIAKMRADFNTTLSTVDFQYNDGRGLPLIPISSESYYVADSIRPLKLPACFVLMGTHAFKYERDQNYLMSDDRILVVISIEQLGDQSITRNAFRYGRALYGTLNLARLSDPTGRMEITCIPQNLSYSEEVVKKMGDREKRFRKDIVLELKLIHIEKNLT